MLCAGTAAGRRIPPNATLTAVERHGLALDLRSPRAKDEASLIIS